MEYRKFRCSRCVHYKGSGVEGVCFWCADREKFETSAYTLASDYRDAAEFEARVSQRLSGAWAVGEDTCWNNHCQLFDKERCTACYLKSARIAVEQEMDDDHNPKN